jgi:xanthosine utilization system XapX-like protein
MDDQVESPGPEEEILEAAKEEESLSNAIPPKKSKRQRSPSLVINFQSWATPIIGVVMLLLGFLVGYLIHPINAPQLAATADSSSASAQTRPTADPTASKQLMDYLVTQVKHFQGDANAPVTLIEFSDFQ